MDDMWLRFSRDQKLVTNKSIQVAEYVIPRRFNGDIKHDVLKLWGVVRNQPGPSTCGIRVHFWTSRDGETWDELGAFPEQTNLGPGTILMACRVPDGLKNYLALTYELTGTFETAPVVDCGLVEKIDDIENGKQIVMQGGYKDLGHIEDFQAAVRLLKQKIEGGEEVPPVEEPEPEEEEEEDETPGGGTGGGTGSGTGGGTPT